MFRREKKTQFIEPIYNEKNNLTELLLRHTIIYMEEQIIIINL